MSAICDGDRIPLEAAGNMLRKGFGNSHAGRERLDQAIREKLVQIWCDGNLVSPEYFADQLRVALAADERFTVAPTSAIGWARSNYVWTVSRKDVLALIEGDKPAAVGNPPKRKPGRKKVYDAGFVVEEAWAYIYEHGCPASLEELANDLKEAVGEEIPELTQAKEFLGRAYDRMERLRKHMGEKPGEERPRRRR